MNEANHFDIYLSLLRQFGSAKVKIAEREACRRDHK